MAYEKMLSRESVKEHQQNRRGYGDGEIDDIKHDLTNTSLTLYDRVEELENELLSAHDDGVGSGLDIMTKKHDKLKEGIGELMEKWNVIYEKDKDMACIKTFCNDLAAIIGEKGGK